MADGNHQEFLWKVHAYQNSYIVFADTKAALILLGCSGLLATLIAKDAHLMCKWERASWTWNGWETSFAMLSVAAFALLFTACLCSVLAIIPRLWTSPNVFPNWSALFRTPAMNRKAADPGVINWNNVLKHKTAVDFLEKVRDLDDKEMSMQIAKHIWTLSTIVSNKMDWTKWAMDWAILGGFAASLFLFFYPLIAVSQ